MTNRDTIHRQFCIIRILRRKPASLAEILDNLKSEKETEGIDMEISKRTFQRDIQNILSLYRISIEYNARTNLYAITSDDLDDARARALEAIDTFSALNYIDKISGSIYFEKRRPAGTQYLQGLLQAIQKRHYVGFKYTAYQKQGESIRQVQPYLLKEFKGRWYLLAKDLKDDKVKSFALDRLSELQVTRTNFQTPAGFNPSAYFTYSFGISAHTGPPPPLTVLSFSPHQGKYIKSLPLHHTQQILIDNEEEVRVAVQVHPTKDFLMEILSHGNEVRVLEPESLVKEVLSNIETAVSNYTLPKKL